MKIAVIGGGAGGLISAGFAAKNGAEVTLFEKNEKIGKKIYITGKGRCNVTNDCEVKDFLSKVVNNSKFLTGSLYSFTPRELMELIESEGVRLKVERGNRVFPESDKASDIIKALERFTKENGVRIRLKTSVKDIIKKNGKFIVVTDNDNTEFDKVIIATGGLSYKSTGSTGDGYNFAKKFGHTIIEPRPALVSILLKDDFVKNVEGLALKNVTLTAFADGKKICSQFGEMLFTKNGISGPIVLTTSSMINRLLHSNITLKLDFKPALSYELLENRILRDFKNNLNKSISVILCGLLPKNFVPILLKKAGMDAYVKANSVTKEERKDLIELLKKFPLSFDDLESIDTAVVTAGGVNVAEINPKTMESKLINNLYFAGEVIDADAFTGGYNLQIAFSTGFTAGNSCAQDKNR